LINAPEILSQGAIDINNYIKENFSLEGIGQEILDTFKSELSIIDDLLPENYDLLTDWEIALSKGALGVT
jgi:hypothetical protein